MTEPVSAHALTELIPEADFHLTALLGKGGTGAVYAARHRGFDVALKVLREDLALSDRERGHFLEEALRMRRVEHHGLVRLLGSGVLSDGRPYLCMPRLRGETLASRLERGPLPLDTAIAIFDTLAQAVAVLHRAGLIHRDIKPENVFLENPPSSDPLAPPHPVLLDFGIARDVTASESTTTAAGQTRGTPAYMAPERFFGAVANVRSDIYELAVTLYFMLTARLPWTDVQSAATRLSPAAPADLGVTLPSELVTVLLRALSTRPEVRPASADAFADAIRRAATPSTFEEGRTTAAMDFPAGRDKPGAPSIAPLVHDAHRSAGGRGPGRWGIGVGVSGALAMVIAAWLVPHARTAKVSETAAPSASPATAPPQAAEVPSASLSVDGPPAPSREKIAEVTRAPAPPAVAAFSAPRPAPTLGAPARANPTSSPPPAKARPVAPSATASASTTSPAGSVERYYRDRK